MWRAWDPGKVSCLCGGLPVRVLDRARGACDVQDGGRLIGAGWLAGRADAGLRWGWGGLDGGAWCP
jgi:hypothetical protein